MAGPLEPNPELGLRARWGGRGALSGVALWAVLIGAVVVLVALTLRLARR